MKINKRELKIGTKVEMEHTKSKRVARKIATDHLKEFRNYYSKGLLPMEKKLKKMQRKKVHKKLVYGRDYEWDYNPDGAFLNVFKSGERKLNSSVKSTSRKLLGRRK